jgi:hypothetical protein
MTITLRNGRLFLKQGERETEIEKVGSNEFRSGGGRLVAVTNRDGKVEYIHSGGRSWRKVT